MFDLKKPCVNCPFRKGMGERFALHPERLKEIMEAPAFQCHKTVAYEHYEDSHKRQGDRTQQCAGLMAVLHREGKPNQIMQVAERLSDFDPDALDPDNEAYASAEDVFKAHCS